MFLPFVGVNMHVCVLSMNYSLPGSSVPGISQPRILEMVPISFSRGSSGPEIELLSPVWQVDSLPLSHQLSPFLPMCVCVFVVC